MIFKKIGVAIVVSSMLAMTGCATILNEKKQNVNVGTTSGIKVSGTIDNVAFEAPGVVALERSKKDKIIKVSDSRCVSSTVASKSVDPIFFVNILSGGVFGSTTDYSTEKMWKYEDNIMINCK